MFLFARLVMDNLQKQSTIADFKKEISPTILPGELHDAYATTLYFKTHNTDHYIDMLESWNA